PNKNNTDVGTTKVFSAFSRLNIRNIAFRRQGILVVVAVVVVLALIAGWWFTGANDGRGNESVDENRVAVFPFTVRGTDDLMYLSEGMVELMSRSIDGAGPVKTVDPKALLTRVEQIDLSGEVGPGKGQKLASNFDAGRFILGSILRVGDNISLSATWYGSDGEVIGSAEVTAKNRQQIQESIDALARRAIADLAGHEAGHRQRLAAQTTSSAEALKAYLEGQEARRSFEMDRAQAAYERAVEEDPDFALAYYGLSWAAGWEGNVDLAISSAAKAVDLSEGLSERDRQLFKAWHSFYKGFPKEAERLYRRIIDSNPNDLDAWQGLGETLFHFNQTRGRPVSQARRSLEEAVKLDPNNSEPIGHLLAIAAIERDSNAVDSLIIKLENLDTDESGIWRRVHTLLFNEGTAAVIDEMSSMGLVMGSSLLFHFGEYQKIEELIESFLASDHTASDEIDVKVILANIYAGMGKFEEARNMLENLGSLNKAVHLIPRAKLAALPFLPDSEKANKERVYLIDRLSSWNPDNDSERFKPSWVKPTDEISLRLYLLALLQSLEGDISTTLEMTDALKNRESPQVFSSLTSDLSHGLLAEIAHSKSDREEALKQLDAIKIQGAMGLPQLYTGARERFLQATLMAENERLEEALRLYRTFAGVDLMDYPYVGPAHLGRAEVLTKLDRPEEAAKAYKRFIKLWSNADPELQPMVAKAKEIREKLLDNRKMTANIER
ncbi:MAG: tetratricopeptide repeat protein, partial [Balneolaceae bacterium]|nr:tetratricopeptide repeat protein [Balneolaceae bacterium]